MASQRPEPGAPVFNVGYPHGQVRVLLWGRIAEDDPTIPLPYPGMRIALVPAQPGMSGGGTFNRYGELVGTISMVMPGFPLTLYTELQ
jgi:hypothetical protein